MSDQAMDNSTRGDIGTRFGSAGKSQSYATFTDAMKGIDQLAEDGVASVALRMQRRNTQGKLQTLGGTFERTLEEFYQWEGWTSANWGGGNYRVEVRDPQQLRVVLFTFEAAIEGPGKLANTQQPGMGVPGMPGANLGYVPGMPGQHPPLSQLDPAARQAYERQLAAANAAATGAPIAMFASDQVLADQVKASQDELAKLRAQREQENAETAKRLKMVEDELAKAREKARDAEANGRVAALEARLAAAEEARKEARNTPTAPSKSIGEILTEMAPVIAAGAPIISAWLGSRESAERRAIEMQQQSMHTLVGVMNRPQPDTTKELITTLGPFLMPLFGKMLEKKDPADQVALFQAMADVQLNNISMMANLVEANAPAPESPAGKVIATALEGIQRMAEAYAAGRGLPGQLAPGPSPMGMLRQPPPAPAYNRGDDEEAEHEDAAPTMQQRAPRPPSPQLQMMLSLAPSEFQTPEWKHLLTLLHTTPPPPAEEFAQMLAGHIENLINLSMLPPQLQMLLEDPRGGLEVVLERLPVAATNPAYVREVLDATLGMLAEDGYIGGPVDESEDEEDGEGDEEAEGEDTDGGTEEAAPEPPPAIAKRASARKPSKTKPKAEEPATVVVEPLPTTRRAG